MKGHWKPASNKLITSLPSKPFQSLQHPLKINALCWPQTCFKLATSLLQVCLQQACSKLVATMLQDWACLLQTCLLHFFSMLAWTSTYSCMHAVTTITTCIWNCRQYRNEECLLYMHIQSRKRNSSACTKRGGNSMLSFSNGSIHLSLWAHFSSLELCSNSVTLVIRLPNKVFLSLVWMLWQHIPCTYRRHKQLSV